MSLLAYDWGTVAVPICVAVIGAFTVIYQVRTQRSNSRDHGTVVEALDSLREDAANVRSDVRNVRDDVRDVREVVLDHLAYHAHDQRRRESA